MLWVDAAAGPARLIAHATGPMDLGRASGGEIEPLPHGRCFPLDLLSPSQVSAAAYQTEWVLMIDRRAPPATSMQVLDTTANISLPTCKASNDELNSCFEPPNAAMTRTDQTRLCWNEHDFGLGLKS
ncbi:hypothetical protein VTI28DRAFT_2702 [Corynascus sepedonium]